MAMNYDPVAGQARSDAFGGRVRGVLDILGRAGSAAAAGFRQFDDAYRAWESEQQAQQEDEAAVMAGTEAAPRRIPDVTRKPQWRPVTATLDADAAVEDAFTSLTEDDFGSQVRPGGKEYKEPDLVLPGARPEPPARRQPTADDVRSASPEARKAAADRRAAEQKSAADAARAQPQRQAAADAGRARGARQQEAREVGINADPAKVEADRQAAVADIRKPKPKSAVQDMQERKDRAAVATDTRRYQQEMAAYDAQRRALETRREAALENGRVDEADALSLQIDQLPVPQPTERMRGGQTAEEVMEPVATTLAKLPEPMRQALRGHLVRQALPAGKTEETASPADMARAERIADESLVAMYDGLEPDARLEAMSEDAERVSAPATMTYGDADRSTRGGFGAGIGDNARNEDMTPEDLRRSGRDVHFGFPMVNKPGQRGGTLIQTPNGAWASRAPNPNTMAAIPGADVLPINPPEMTREWRDGMKMAGVTLGLDPSKFDNENQFIAAAQQLLERHRTIAENYDTVAVATGGYRYTPNEARKAKTRKLELTRRVDDFIKMYPDAPAEELYALADAGDADGLLAKQNETRRTKKTERAKAARDYELREARTRQMRNPNIAPAMFVEDLNQAGDDPAAVAQVYRQHGMPGEAARVEALRNQREASQFENEQKKAEIDAMSGRGKKEDPKPDEEYLRGSRDIMDAALGEKGRDQIPADQAARARALHEQRFGDKDADEKDGAYLNGRDAVSRGAPMGLADPVVSHALSTVASSIPRGIARGDGFTVRSETTDGIWDSQRTTFIKRARELVVGDKFTDEELGRWFDTNRLK